MWRPMLLISEVERQKRDDQEVKVRSPLATLQVQGLPGPHLILSQRIKQQSKSRQKPGRLRACCSVVVAACHCEAFGLISKTTE